MPFRCRPDVVGLNVSMKDAVGVGMIEAAAIWARSVIAFDGGKRLPPHPLPKARAVDRLVAM